MQRHGISRCDRARAWMGRRRARHKPGSREYRMPRSLEDAHSGHIMHVRSVITRHGPARVRRQADRREAGFRAGKDGRKSHGSQSKDSRKTRSACRLQGRG